MHSRLVLAAAVLAAIPLTLHAAEAPKLAATGQAAPRALGGAKGWNAYAAGSGKTLVCYLVGKPAKTLPANVKRGNVDAHITHRPGENAVDVVNFELGYPAKPDSDAALVVDGKNFSLFTSKDGAWTRDAATDKAVTIAMSKGRSAVLKATSEHNSVSTDTYELAGFDQALALIDHACNVKQ